MILAVGVGLLHSSLACENGNEVDPIYRSTRQTCDNHPELRDPALGDVWLYREIFTQGAWQTVGATLTWNADAIVHFYYDRGLSHALANLFLSQSFIDAVNDCTHGDAEQKRLFMARLLVADIGSKAVGGAVTAAVMYGSYRGVRFLSRQAAAILGEVALGVIADVGTVAYITLAPSHTSANDTITGSKQEMTKFLENKINSPTLQIYKDDLEDFNDALAIVEKKLKASGLSATDRDKLMDSQDRLQKSIVDHQARIKQIESSSLTH